jgi:hypothetical protein
MLRWTLSGDTAANIYLLRISLADETTARFLPHFSIRRYRVYSHYQSPSRPPSLSGNDG